MRNGKKMRRTVFIKRGFQMRFITWVVALLILCGICSAAVLYPFLSSEISSEFSTGHRNIGDIKRHLALAIIIGNVLAVIVAALATTVVILYISHKIAGPLYRFEKVCNEIARGSLDASAVLREHDQLEGLSAAFGNMLTQLRNSRNERHIHLEAARNGLNALKETLSGQPAARELVASVEKPLAMLAGETQETRAKV